jgi:predicted ferric reductase
MTRFIYAVFWILVYLTLALAPLFVLMVSGTRPGRGFWTEFSVALGFAGLAMIGLQFLLTARYRALTTPYGIDVVYHFHRQISIVAFVLILAHPVILFITRPTTLQYLNLAVAPWSARLGVLAVVALVFVIVTSVYRLNLRFEYEPWRISHGIFATLAIVLAMGHVVLVGYYVDSPGKQAVWLILGAIWIGALLYIRIIKPINMLRRPYKIEEIKQERGDVYTLVLKPDGHQGMQFKPGQFAWLTIWSSPFAIKEHPFSFSSSSMQNGYYEMAIKELGDFTSKVKTIQPGTTAYLDGPYGVFSIDDHPAEGYVFLAGGIGITPIISSLRTMADRNDSRPVLLIYGNKTWEDLTFREELDELKNAINMEIVYVLEDPPEGWEGETGFVTPQLLARYLPDNRMDLEYFICGPGPMMDAVENGLTRLGISLEQTQAERFNLV